MTTRARRAGRWLRHAGPMMLWAIALGSTLGAALRAALAAAQVETAGVPLASGGTDLVTSLINQGPAAMLVGALVWLHRDRSYSMDQLRKDKDDELQREREENRLLQQRVYELQQERVSGLERNAAVLMEHSEATHEVLKEFSEALNRAVDRFDARGR